MLMTFVRMSEPPGSGQRSDRRAANQNRRFPLLVIAPLQDRGASHWFMKFRNDLPFVKWSRLST